MNNYTEHFANRLAEMLDKDLIAHLIAGTPLDYTPPTRKEKVVRWFGSIPRYLTRYKVVDTWHIHDDCEY